MVVVERVMTVVNDLGLHARPAGEFVKVASRFESDVWVAKDGEPVNGKSIMGVMTLAAECGSRLKVRAEGVAAEAAGAACERLVAAGFATNE